MVLTMEICRIFQVRYREPFLRVRGVRCRFPQEIPHREAEKAVPQGLSRGRKTRGSSGRLGESESEREREIERERASRHRLVIAFLCFVLFAAVMMAAGGGAFLGGASVPWTAASQLHAMTYLEECEDVPWRDCLVGSCVLLSDTYVGVVLHGVYDVVATGSGLFCRR